MIDDPAMIIPGSSPRGAEEITSRKGWRDIQKWIAAVKEKENRDG